MRFHNRIKSTIETVAVTLAAAMIIFSYFIKNNKYFEILVLAIPWIILIIVHFVGVNGNKEKQSFKYYICPLIEIFFIVLLSFYVFIVKSKVLLILAIIMCFVEGLVKILLLKEKDINDYLHIGVAIFYALLLTFQ